MPSLVSPRSSPHPPCSPVPPNGHFSPPPMNAEDGVSEEGHLRVDADTGTPPTHEQQVQQQEETPPEEVEKSRSSLIPRPKLSRIPVPSSLLLSSPTSATTPTGSAKQKLLLKKAHQHQGATLLSPSRSPSLSQRCIAPQPASSSPATADRSQDEESLQGVSVSDRQGDEAPSLSSSSGPLSRKSRIPRPLRSEGSPAAPESRSSQFVPRPPPGKPPSRPSIDGR